MKIQELLKQHNIKYYIVPTSDDHNSEMVGDYYKFREYLSGFTGSAGTLIIGQDEAYLWTDGRYYLQAEQQLHKDITLMKSGMPGVVSVETFLFTSVNNGDRIGFNGTVTNVNLLWDLIGNKFVKLIDIDLSYIWKDRPERSHEPIYLYDEKYHGESTSSKLKKIRHEMIDNDVDSHILTTLDDICWICNIRGHDVLYTPVCLCFMIIYFDHCDLYLQEGTYTKEIEDYFIDQSIFIKDYDTFYDDVAFLEGTTWADLSCMNYTCYKNIHCEIVDDDNPSTYMKCIKNTIEIENTKNAHIKDGVALTKFMFDLKMNICGQPQSEIELSHKLLQYRQEQDLFIEPSFETISAYGEHGAIIHYAPTKETDILVKSEGLYLVDSGGQYLDGTTDVTRTFVLGELDNETKRDFTLVLKGFLRLMNCTFPFGTTGTNLDILARSALWNDYKDFRHGTGHGVGHMLSVHEGPQSIRPRPLDNDIQIMPGMITSDEPGYYKENHYGIRHENLLLCVKDKTNEYGEFYKFEPLTLVPIDLDGVDISLLNEEERQYLNNYHKLVRDTLYPYLTEDENIWMEYATRDI